MSGHERGAHRKCTTAAEMGIEEGRMGKAGVIRSFACAALLALTLVGCSSAQPPKAVNVSIEGLVYAPEAVTVARGDTVVWTNEDIVPHTVTARDGAFDSGMIAAGATWRYVVREKGMVEYYCTFHPTMKGTLKVE
jgi:plastocyanin